MTVKKRAPQRPRESPVVRYDITLRDVTTKSIHFICTRSPLDKFDANYSCQIQPQLLRREETEFEISLSVTIVFKNSDERPFDASFMIAGVYTHKPGLPESVVDYFVNVNGPVMLWPHMRELVASVTMRAGFRPLYLETIDVAKFQESAIQRLTTPANENAAKN